MDLVLNAFRPTEGTHVVTLASIQGLVQPRGVFLRTPKSKARSSLIQALLVARWEAGVGIVCGLVALALVIAQPGFAAVLLVVLLLWQASLYLCAPTYSLLSVRQEPVRLTSRGDVQGRVMRESRAAYGALALLLLLLLGYGLLRFLPEATVIY